MAVNREQVIQTAERYVSRGKIDAAIKEYRKLLEENPTDAGTLNRVGDLWVRLSRMDEACRIYAQTADHYTTDGFFVKAIAIYKKIIKLDPTRLEVYENLAELYHKQGLINEARSQYQVLADYYFKHDNAASAIAILQKMGQLEPENPTHHVKLAEIYRQQRLLDKALQEYRTIADLMLAKGHVDEATQVLLRALDVNSEDIGFITNAVLGLRDAGHNAAAARLLAAALQRNPQAEKIAHLAGMDRVGARAPAPAAPPAPRATAPVAVPRPPAPPPPPPAGDLEADVDSEFVLDADAEAGLPPEFAPPRAAAPAVAEREIDLDLGALEELGAPAPPAPPVPAAPAAPEAPVEIDWSFEPEPEIPPPPGPQLAEAPPPELRIDAEALERTAAELQPSPVSREEDLVAEAEVFAKYGLKEKAQERLREVLHANPRHLGAHAQLIALHLEGGRHDRVLPLAVQMANLTARSDPYGAGAEAWQQVRQRLLRAGYRVSGDEIEPPTAHGAPPDRVSALLHDLVEGHVPVVEARPPAPEAVRPPPPARKPRPPRALEAELAALASEVLTPRKATRPKARPAVPPAAAPAVVPPVTPLPARLPGSVPLDEELPGFALPEEIHPAAAPAPPPAGSLDDSGTSWLDAAGVAASAARPAEEKLFEDEDEFFDLAAELERELSEAEGLRVDAAAQPPEQSLEEIVEGFKKGVAENLSPEAYDTHFNLGIAYREMALLDEAIGEFQLAAKDPNYLVDCCSMLGICFLEKGLPELAVKWYRRGLEAPRASEEQTLGLLYDLGNVLATSGDREGAYKTYVEVYGINSNYRDVVARLEELGRR